jgi:hypothetical protein
MQYQPSLVIALVAALAAACGDNHDGAPDAAGPDAGLGPDAADAADAAPDATTPAVCRTDLAAGDLASGAWDPRFTVPGVAGMDGIAPTLFDFARDLDGSIVAAGKLDYLGADRVAPLLRLREGRWQPARTTWELPLPGAGFSAVAIGPDGALALATYDNFPPYTGELWLDDGSGLRVIGRFAGAIRRLAWYDGGLWAGGWMEVALEGDAVIRGLAVWNGATWSPPPGGATGGFVHELVLDGDELLVGGNFAEMGGIAAANVAAYDGVSWRALGLPGDLGVYALARGPDGELYAGGALGDFGDDDAAGGLARWTGTAWVKAGGGVGKGFYPGVVTDLVLHDGGLVAAGCFDTVGGGAEAPGAIESADVARWDGAWHSLDDGSRGVIAPWIEPGSCGDSGPGSVWEVSKQRLFSAGDQLLLGGSFAGIAGVMSQGVIGHDGDRWRAQGAAAGLGVGGSIDRIGVAADTCEVWGHGALSHVAGAPVRGRVVRFDGTAWTSVDDTAAGIPRTAYCPAFSVSAQGEVALACYFLPEGAKSEVSRLFRVERRAEGDRMVQVGGDLPLINTLEHDADGRLWVGGGGATGFLGHIEGDALVMVEDGFDGPVHVVDPGPAGEVVVGGTFTRVGELAAPKIARFTPLGWRPLGEPPGSVAAIAHTASDVYVSTYDEGSGSLLLGRWDGAAWTELGSAAAGITPHRHFIFYAIRVVDDAVIAAGSAVLDDQSARGALVYRGGVFRGLGGGVNAIGLSDLAITREAVWVAGLIAEAGAGASKVSTVGVARYAITR